MINLANSSRTQGAKPQALKLACGFAHAKPQSELRTHRTSGGSQRALRFGDLESLDALTFPLREGVKWHDAYDSLVEGTLGRSRGQNAVGAHLSGDPWLCGSNPGRHGGRCQRYEFDRACQGEFQKKRSPSDGGRRVRIWFPPAKSLLRTLNLSIRLS